MFNSSIFLRRNMMKKIIMVLAFFVLITACSSTGVTTPDSTDTDTTDGVGSSSVVGTWNLSVVGGQPIPLGFTRLTFTSSTYAIEATGGASMLCPESGTYSLSGSTITLTVVTAASDSACDPVGTISTLQFTVTKTNLTFVDSGGNTTIVCTRV